MSELCKIIDKTDYCSYNASELLKAVGYNEACDAYYHLEKGDDSFEVANCWDFYNSRNFYRIGAPFLWFAQKWLRTNAKIDIDVRYNYIGKYYFATICDNGDYFEQVINDDTKSISFNKYEDALDKAICLAVKHYIKIITKLRTE